MSQDPKNDQVAKSRSTILEKIPADLRGDIDRAVVNRDPPTYRAVFEKFDLARRGVSLTAFYYYARRIRARAEWVHIAELAAEGRPEEDVTEFLPRILAHRLFDAAIDESTSPRTLQRLADAWRVAAATRLALHRHTLVLEDARKRADKKDMQELCDIAKQYGRLVREDQRTQLARALEQPAPG